MLKGGKEYEEEKSPLLSAKVSIVLIFLSFICNIISFVTPYWIVSIENKNTGFRILGLWVACFDNFIYPEDYISKAYDGCWYIYYPEFKYITDWLIPPWLYACQVLAILALGLNLIAMALFAMKIIRMIRPSHLKSTLGVIALQSIVASCFIIITILIGNYSKDRAWQPRPDHNRVSWSFAFAVLAGFFAILSVMSLLTNYISWKSKILHYKIDETGRSFLPNKSVIGSAFNPGGSYAPTGTMPSLFQSNLPSAYPIGSHITQNTVPPGGSSGFHSRFDAKGRPILIGTSGAAVSDRLREALAEQKYDTSNRLAEDLAKSPNFISPPPNNNVNLIMDTTV